MRVQVVLRTPCTRSFAKSAGRCSPLRTPCTRSFATCARRCSRRRTPCTHSFAACPVLILLRPPRAFFFLQVPPPSCWSGAAPLLLHPPCFLSLCSPRRCSPSELVLTFSGRAHLLTHSSAITWNTAIEVCDCETCTMERVAATMRALERRCRRTIAEHHRDLDLDPGMHRLLGHVSILQIVAALVRLCQRTMPRNVSGLAASSPLQHWHSAGHGASICACSKCT